MVGLVLYCKSSSGKKNNLYIYILFVICTGVKVFAWSICILKLKSNETTSCELQDKDTWRQELSKFESYHIVKTIELLLLWIKGISSDPPVLKALCDQVWITFCLCPIHNGTLENFFIFHDLFHDSSIYVIPAGYNSNGLSKRNWITPYVCMSPAQCLYQDSQKLYSAHIKMIWDCKH